ncbi:tRNA-splicing endonuclease subunit Sen2 [Parastagonospora nodorum]|nr:tRNA-splicing endonuclease subunit Sen2 [Parastagonospora nodorum]KAH4192278.1 tRNA-splicing endonuclease subunit Sen2 [Parastagonospora nodorum]KAH4346598.1 tRNA-splicing endonuclease subunit Sen2 [Parastagonospora nodorum]KAH4385668.1 tRNA-splicing endonuclease subunit Sen2 [Parastagonospora nodorum]KAH4399573.1 tRNA-splicing endonuclease subunit Sen2 [Parastagonospora nodorum]
MAVDLEAQTPVQDSSTTGTTSQPSHDKNANGALRKPRPRRPNFNEIHAKPLPVDVYPLPAFIPHNPISIVRIAISLLSHSIFPPKSHPVVHRAYFSPQTQSIHVTDPVSIRALWEQGFWGKGSLSRSEPQWLAGEKKKRGVQAGKTSAEVTQNRREERKQFKLERARAQREAIEQQLRQEGKLDADGTIEDLVENGQVSESPKGTLYNPDAGDVVAVGSNDITLEVERMLAEEAADGQALSLDDIKDQEHLQLTPEEAFFLTYTLGALCVVSEDGPTDSYPTWFLLRLYALHGNSPVPEQEMRQLQNVLRKYEHDNIVLSDVSNIPSVEPDSQFILRYVVFHHFRSLGWVVRPGIKFAVDYLLYLRGPAFHHAEFAIMIIPSYSHPYWTEAPEHESGIEARKKELGKKDWWWLHRVNRVQTAVFKTLVLVYVEIPPPWDKDKMEVDIGSVLKQYTVREVILKRWSPNRNRD